MYHVSCVFPSQDQKLLYSRVYSCGGDDDDDDDKGGGGDVHKRSKIKRKKG